MIAVTITFEPGPNSSFKGSMDKVIDSLPSYMDLILNQ